MKNKDFRTVKAAAVSFAAWRARRGGAASTYEQGAQDRIEDGNAVIGGVGRFSRYDDILILTGTQDAARHDAAKKEMIIPLDAVDPGCLAVVLESNREEPLHRSIAFRALLHAVGGGKLEEDLVSALGRVTSVSAEGEVASIFAGKNGISADGGFNAAALSLRQVAAQAEEALSTYLHPVEFHRGLEAAAQVADAAARKGGGQARRQNVTLTGLGA